MKKIFRWLRTSHSAEHLIGGIAIGAGAMSIYGALYAGLGIASAFEFKDKFYVDKWSWLDWSLTLVGVIIGQSIHQILHYTINKEIKII